MIEDIHIKDFALIHETSLDFDTGFTVLSGETGAGKSILIGAVSFLLGGKASLDVIRKGAHEASVSGTIFISDAQKEAYIWLEEHGIETENNRVLLRRIVRDTGKTAAWINSVPVTRNDLADFTSFFVDIHGQHEHQSLMKVQEHRRFLDAYGGITDAVRQFNQLYTQVLEKRKVFAQLNTSDKERNQKIDYLSFAIAEISDAQLKDGEEESLEAEEYKLSQYEKLYDDIETISECFHAEGNNIVNLSKKIHSYSTHAANIDENFSSLASRFESLFYEISDLSKEIVSFQNGLVFDPERLNFVQERLALIFKLKKKYASVNGTVQDILDFQTTAEKELIQLSSSEENRSALQKEIKDLEALLYQKGKEISCVRKKVGLDFAKKIEDILALLGMAGSSFAVSITEKENDDIMQKCGPYGFDNIEFLIQANKGTDLKPLAKIASGGELSRVMLALKTVLASSDTVDTLIFDEIDTGIGGEIARAVGEHLKKLAQCKQILCITHLATIAVFADNQMKIEKSSDEFITKTSVSKVEDEMRVREIARMLAGDTVNEASLEHARSLLQNYGG